MGSDTGLIAARLAAAIQEVEEIYSLQIIHLWRGAGREWIAEWFDVRRPSWPEFEVAGSSRQELTRLVGKIAEIEQDTLTLLTHIAVNKNGISFWYRSEPENKAGYVYAPFAREVVEHE